MSYTAPYRRQHEELERVVSQIWEKLTFEQVLRDPESIVQLLASLADRLNVHLAMEDNALYPRLMHSANPATSETAHHFQQEMGGIRAVFTRYAEKWNSADQLMRAPTAFIAETRSLFAALERRILRENTILYPMADAL